MSLFINLYFEPVELLVEKALFWPAMEMLIAADLHLEETPRFKKLGISEGSMEEDLNRLEDLAMKKKAKRCLILGNGLNLYILEQLSKWVKRVRCPLYLSTDNQGFKKNLLKFGIAASGNPLIIPPFAFCSQPPQKEISNYYLLAGSLNPQVVLKKGSESVSLPCFYVREKMMALPSFGNSLEGQTISWTSSEKVYATTGNSIIEL